MSVLLREIDRVSQAAAGILQKAGFVSDDDIKSLTRQDLNELFPGEQKLRLRKTIDNLIQNAKPINAVLRELMDFIPDDCVKAALTKNGVLNDYLVILRDMQSKVENIQSFLEAHIGLFEEYAKKQEKALSGSSSVDAELRCIPGERQSYGRTDGQARSTSSSVDLDPRCPPAERQTYGRTDDHSQGSVAAQRTVKVKSVVKGQTFDCHRTLLQRVRELGGLHVEEAVAAHKVVVVFCPVSSRHMTDIEAAMKDIVPGGAAVVLVVMHHTHDAHYANVVRSLGGDRGWDFVNVLYHETVRGLLTCAFNDQAVAQLRDALLKHSSAVASPAAVHTAAAAAGSSMYGGGGSGKNKSSGGGGGWFSGGLFGGK